MNAAFPALVSCAAPTIWMSSQCAAEASQKVTVPRVTGVVPATTVAVSVTTDSAATVVTAEPPLVTARLMLVAVCANAGADKPNEPSKPARAQMQAHVRRAQVRRAYARPATGPPATEILFKRSGDSDKCFTETTSRMRVPGGLLGFSL